MKKSVFCFLLILLFQFRLSGETNVDSLKGLLPQSIGVEKLQTLEKLSDYYINTNLDSSFYYLMLLKNAASRSQNIKYEAIAFTSLGLNYFYKGKYFDAEDHVQKAIKLQKQIKDSSNLADSYNFLAGIYGESGQYLKSIYTLFEAIAIFEIKNDQKGLVTAYNNLGFLYMKLDDYGKAMQYYKKAIYIINNNHLNNNKGFLYSNIGICYKEFNKNDSALIYYRKGLIQYRVNQTLNAIPMLYQSIGNLYGFRLNQIDSALYYFHQGIEIANEYDPNSLIELYYSLGLILKNQGKYSESIHAFKISLANAENNNNLNGQMQAHYEMYQTYKRINDLQSAIKHFEFYTNIKDSVDSQKTKTTIARLDEKYQNDKNKLLIQKLKQEQISDQQLKIQMLLGIAILFILLVFILFAFFQRKKRNKLEKSLMNVENQKMEKEIRFHNKQLASQALMMMQKNKMLQSLYITLQEAGEHPPENCSGLLNGIQNQVRISLHSDKDWELFKLYFEQVNKSFFKELKKINPSLNQHDIRLAALIKLRLNIKEAASVLNLSPNSIKGARSRLRGKLHLKSGENLTEFIEHID